MEKLEEFFEFLENHLKSPIDFPNGRSGFEEMKKKYTLDYWKSYHNNGNFIISKETDNLYFVDIGGTVHIEGIQNLYEDYELYLNEDEQILLRKTKFQDIETEWKNTESNFYDNLKILYYEKFGSFYNEILRYILHNFPQGNHEQFIKIILIRIEYYKKIANSDYFSVKYTNEDKRLLFYYLDELVKKILSGFLQSKDLDNTINQEKGEEILDLNGKNLFNAGSIKEVKEFFENFTLLKLSDDSEPVLSSSQVDIFLKRAFLKDLKYTTGDYKIRMHFNPKRQNLKLIEYIFYRFFLKSQNEFGEASYGNKEKYVKLLTDNFDGFNASKVGNNFALKPDIPKELESIISGFKAK